MRGALLEICIESLASAIAAQEGGAHRVELCAGMAWGGITPSSGLIRSVRRRLRIPVHVLVRPRPGDFVYSRDERAILERDIAAALELGADGVVIGVLDASGRVDRRHMAALVRAARPMAVTFHRAFDSIRRPYDALEALADLGVERVLTSGGAASAPDGIRRLRILHERAPRGIAIIAGGGIDRRGALAVLRSTGVRELHVGSAACRLRRSGRGAFRQEIGEVDPRKVKRLVRIVEDFR